MPKEITQAEIIPYEPDAVNTDEGIVLKKDIRHKIFSQTVITFSLYLLCKTYNTKSFMKIKVNNKETELTQGNNVASLAQQLELPEQGVAVALNNRMIPRSQWAEQEIKEGDSLVIIKAACGG